MLKTIIPTSLILKKHIECFYFYSGESSSKLRYLAFPHYNTGLSFFKGAFIQRQKYQVEIVESTNSRVSIEILGKYTCPVLVDYTGQLQEIAIIFKPLGISRFFRENYQTIASDFSQELKSSTWSSFGDNIFSEDLDISKLETFLISQYVDTDELSKLDMSLNLVNNPTKETAISEIALKLGYNTKTFQRHFNKHMGCSPIEYRRICRFRNSIDAKLGEKEIKTLTEITYESGYFDQSYFIKEFKKLTHHNPKEFFKVANTIDGEYIIWEIL
ncbi:helix-turn-helix domain-containing protein [Flavobacterium paronense]|uniref:Helix-turn-helix domain-containing protein n=1 Tax=Flavobacterium paronense TaxID=1392775 RepID=A0ABV5GE69_9FLAO|nr:helix-turn-helix domain-containing protein [Flavobacterium paronense]MDN3678242.1 helix-turn-helix domain-containing protein [Flavobacterium paronense]